jgi:SAM-dependent methyltransferase
MRSLMRYAFNPVAACDMCGSTNFAMLGMRLNTSQGLRPRRAAGISVPIKRCRTCGLIFADPQPVPDDLSDHYGLPPEDYWAGDAFTWTPDYFANEIAAAKSLLSFSPAMTALDVGVGLGKAMKSLAAAGFDAWGIEPSSAFRDKAISGMELDADRVQLAAVETAEFPDAHFDFITFGAVLEHLYSPSHALERALSWLKPGGIIQAEVPSSKWMVAKFVNAWFQMAGTNYVTHLSPMHPPYHLFEFGLRSFELNGHLLGYSVARHDYMTCQVLHLPVKALFRRIMDATDTGMQLTVYLQKVA